MALRVQKGLLPAIPEWVSVKGVKPIWKMGQSYFLTSMFTLFPLCPVAKTIRSDP